MDRFQASLWFLVACWLGLQDTSGASQSCKLPTDWKSGAIQTKPAYAGSIQSAKADFGLVAAIFNRQVFLQKWDAPDTSAALPPPIIPPSAHPSSSPSPHSPTLPLSHALSSSPSSKCPAEVEVLISLMLKDLPSYANRVMQRSRRLSRNTGSMSYVITAGRPEFEPLTLGPGQYTPPASTAGLEPPKQVFFTTLERQYRAGKASNMQLYHWLFLTQTTDGWRVAMMFSRIGSASKRPPTPPLESSKGVVGQAVKLWLRDCRAGAIRGSSSPSIQNPKPKL